MVQSNQEVNKTSQIYFFLAEKTEKGELRENDMTKSEQKRIIALSKKFLGLLSFMDIDYKKLSEILNYDQCFCSGLMTQTKECPLRLQKKIMDHFQGNTDFFEYINISKKGA